MKDKRTFPKWPILIIILSLFLASNLAAKQRGIKVVIKDTSGREIGLYKGSYALLIGVSNYTAGWPKLHSVPSEIKQVEATLKKQGFHVVKVMNPTSEQLSNAFEDFIDNYGFDQNNRLLFFFSGHGHTRKDGQKGYLVPTDAPNPNKDMVGFLRKALPMNMILAWSRQVETKHALFLFDSCFSGTVFKGKDLPEKPPHISRATTLPVRQYITAGDAGETVPAKSVFTPAFIDALEYGWGDLNNDGYVSGTELGLYLQEKVPQHSRQNPQYGKIKDYDLARGDFIFQLASSGATVVKPSPEVSHTTLSVRANVTGARVLVDGRRVGETPLADVEVSPGDRRITVQKQGYEPYRKQIRIDEGRSLSLYVDLSKAQPRKGRLFVETAPEDAKVRILNIGPVFYQGMELDPGRYNVEVSASGYKSKKRWVEISAGEDESISIRLEAVVAEQTGRKFTNSVGMTFVKIPSGTFMMGSRDSASEMNNQYSGSGVSHKNEHPQHRVTISKPFYMQATEVTVGQWHAFTQDSGYKSEAETGGGVYVWTGLEHEKKEDYYWGNPGFEQSDKNPVTCVSWNDVQAFLKWLNGKEGKTYRLPTEAEWEYAARAGTKTPFYTGDCLPTGQANYNGTYHPGKKCAKGVHRKKITRVGLFSPNPWGLYDMHGNVLEWVQDWYGGYPSGSVTDPTGPPSGPGRVVRGGSWKVQARFCRSANRARRPPWDVKSRNTDLGFRLARDN